MHLLRLISSFVLQFLYLLCQIQTMSTLFYREEIYLSLVRRAVLFIFAKQFSDKFFQIIKRRCYVKATNISDMYGISKFSPAFHKYLVTFK